EFVQNPRVRLLDLVEQHNREWLLAHCVGELTADVVTHVPGGRADQPLIRVFRAELRHVEADIGALVAEEQTGDRLRELGLSNARRSREKRDPSWSTSAPGRADTRDRSLDDIEHVNDGVFLPLHALLDELEGMPDLVAVDLHPRIFGNTYLVASYRI